MPPSLDGTQTQVQPASALCLSGLDLFPPLGPFLKKGRTPQKHLDVLSAVHKFLLSLCRDLVGGRLDPFIESPLSLQVRDEWHLSSHVCECLLSSRHRNSSPCLCLSSKLSCEEGLSLSPPAVSWALRPPLFSGKLVSHNQPGLHPDKNRNVTSDRHCPLAPEEGSGSGGLWTQP